MYHDAYSVMVPCIASAAAVDPFKSTISGTAEFRWTPGYIPHVVRAVAVTVVTTAGFSTGTDPVLSVRKGTFGATTATADEQDTITLTSGMAAGDVKYLDNLNISVNPGQSICVVASTLPTAALTIGVQLFVEPKHEVPGNITTMTETA